GTKNEAGICCLSSSFKMRGMAVIAPYSPLEYGTGRGPEIDSLSTSNVMQTATRAPLGQDFGFNLIPARAPATACLICSSVASIGMGGAPLGKVFCDCPTAGRARTTRSNIV